MEIEKKIRIGQKTLVKPLILATINPLATIKKEKKR